MTIRNIFIDFGGVLLRTEDKEPRTRQAEAFGLTCRELEKIVFENESSLRASLGEIPEEAHWQAVAETLRVPRAEVRTIANDFFAGDRENEALLGFLRSLKPERQVCLISNAWSGLRAWITTHGLADVFDHMIISAEVGLVKPDTRIFSLALEDMNAKAEESVFIDDILANVEAAQSIGMAGIHFVQPGKALDELKHLIENHR